MCRGVRCVGGGDPDVHAENWRNANYTCSCADASGALVEEPSFVAGPPSADETSLVDALPLAAINGFHNAATDQMNEVSNAPGNNGANGARYAGQ